ncbi:intracellular hyaluronan-binding protein 4-like [Anguilla anguilla]|uniref:intracellular hyaluronan-binding protein 4-like n=1 Tax=Anguilla anguilla TaxID=7936 RepID=UPI0015A8FB30|nr:intracellular hyaluronan-binding protein 4-like [Anguilla anguilla]
MHQDSFGCAVTNRFDQLLDDEADPFDILREAELQKQKKKKKEDLKKANAAKQGKKESQKDRKVPNTGDGGVGHIRNNSGWKRSSRGGHAQNENSGVVATEREERRAVFRERRPNQMVAPQQFPADAPQARWDRGGRRREWGRGRGQGYPGNSDGFVQGARKEFVHREQSDRVTRAADGERGAAKEDQEAVEPEGQPRAEGEAAEAEAAEEEAAPDVAMEMSLDQWKALQEQSRPKEELKLRKVDASVPSKAVVIHKSKNLEGKGVIEEYEDAYVFRRPANDITTTLAFNFGSLPRPGRGGRGGRGGQGGRGRGRGRGQGQTERALTPPPPPPPPPPQAEVVLAPDPDDPDDFPALG